MIEKEVKQYDEQIFYLEKSAKVDKEDIINHYNAQKDFLKKYLPSKMSYDELEAYIKNMFESHPELMDKTKMGDIFKLVKTELGNNFEGKSLNEIIKKLLG